MNSRQWGVNAYASLKGFAGLLAVSLLFLALGSNAFAQENPYAWPYFGPDPEVKSFLNAAFMAQAGIMGAFAQTAGGSGSSTAMQIIGALCALVGGIVLAFNRKAWTPSVVLGWLTVVIIIVFVPINMRLLFAPVPDAANANIGGGLLKAYGSDMANRVNYGFAPQMAAVDVASRAQVIVSDMFRSNGWRDITAELFARERMNADGKLSAGPLWLKKMNEFAKYCPGTTLDQVINPSTADAKELASTGKVLTFGEVWNQIIDQYKDNGYATIPPPLIVLYDEDNEKELPAGFDTGIYANAINTLYGEVVEKGKTVTWTPETSAATDSLNAENINNPPAQTATDTLSVKNALEALDEADFFSLWPIPNWIQRGLNPTKFAVGPGFVMLPYSQFQQQKNTADGFVEARCGYGNGIWKYNTKISGPKGGGQTDGIGALSCNVADDSGGFTMFQSTNAKLHKADILTINSQITGVGEDEDVAKIVADKTAGGVPPNWETFIKVFPALSGAPVGTANIIGLKSANKADVLEQKTYDCLATGKYIIDQAFDLTTGGAPNDAFKPLKEILTAKGALPADGKNFKATDIAVGAAEPGKTDGSLDDSWQATATYLKYALDGKLRDARNFARQQTNNANSLDGATQALQGKDELVRIILTQSFLNTVHTATLNKLAVGQTDAETGTFDDQTKARIVGNNFITNIGGNVAYFFGIIGTNVLAFFTGAMAQAFVYFLQMLIQLTILCLIVLTPFLFLGGALMPRAAPGVLIISVVVAFIMQFVPVTWIILNYMGGLIYEIIAAINPRGAYTLQSMLIIVMSTLYAGVVSLTLYLMFKLGDPSAMIGRLGALDSAAKDIAGKGLAMAMAAAGTAAAIAGATLIPAIGAKGFGAMKKAALDEAAKRLPGAGAMMSVAAAVQERHKGEDGGTKEASAAESVLNKTNEEDIAAFENEGGRDFSGPGPVSEADTRLSSMIAAGNADSIKQGISANGGEFNIGKTSDNRNIMAKMDSSGRLFATLDPPLDGIVPPAPKPVTAGNGVENPEDAETTDPELDRLADDGGKVPDDSEDKKIKNVISGAQNGGDNNATIVAAQPGKGQPVPVDVVKGQLQSIEKLPELKMAEDSSAKAPQTEQQQKAAEIGTMLQEQEKIKDTAAINQIDNLLNQRDTTAENKEKLLAAREKLLAGEGVASVGPVVEEALKDQAKHLGVDETKIRKITGLDSFNLVRDEKIKDLESQQDHWIAQARQQYEQASKIDTAAGRKMAEDMKKKLDELERMDPLGTSLGEHQQRLAAQKNDEMRNDQLKLDIATAPSFGKIALSGFYGSVSGLFSGAGSFPVLGKAIKEVTNEWYQAPERARAMNAVGIKKWWSAQGDAQRMGHFSKEVSPLAAAAQYDAVRSMGMFEGNIRLAQQAATEAVAQSRSNFEALRFRLDKMESDDRSLNLKVDRQGFMAAGDLYGLGLENAIGRVNSVYVDSLQGRDGTFNVRVAKYKTNEKGQKVLDGDELVKIRKTTEVLNDVSMSMTSKAAGGAWEATMMKFYGLYEKRFHRENSAAGWTATKNIESRTGVLEMGRLDPDDNYLAGGHLNMVQGKADFFGFRGRYQAYTQLRNQNNVAIMDYIQKNPLQFNIDANVRPTLNSAAMQTAIKTATKEIGAVNLPLNAVFEEAMSTGSYTILQKSYAAKANVDALKSETMGKIMGSYSEYFDNNLAKIDSRLRQNMRIEHNGRRVDFGKGLEFINKKLIIAADMDFNKSLKLIEATQKAWGSLSVAEQEKAFTIAGETLKDGNRKVGQSIRMLMSESMKKALDNAYKDFGITAEKVAKYGKRGSDLVVGEATLHDDDTLSKTDD